MKNVLILLVLLLSVKTYAVEQIDLVDKEYEISMDGVSTSFEVIRSEATPKKISLKINYKRAVSKCTEYETDTVWVPPTRAYICEPDSEVCREVDGRRICHRVQGQCAWEYVSGYYDERTVCVAHQDIHHPISQIVKLNFKKSHKLAANAREVFQVKIDQLNRYRKQLEMSGEVIEASGQYKIKSSDSIFTYLTLNFKKK